jgi:hypothetical protein
VNCLYKQDFSSHVSFYEMRASHPLVHIIFLLWCERKHMHEKQVAIDQWYSTGGTRTPGGTRRHLRGYVKFKISIYILCPE